MEVEKSEYLSTKASLLELANQGSSCSKAESKPLKDKPQEEDDKRSRKTAKTKTPEQADFQERKKLSKLVCEASMELKRHALRLGGDELEKARVEKMEELATKLHKAMSEMPEGNEQLAEIREMVDLGKKLIKAAKQR